MTQQRLPYVNGDDGDWGNILNQFIGKEHYDTGLDDPENGGHKNITIRAGGTAPGSAPLKFTLGLGTSILTTPEAGAMEASGPLLYYSGTDGLMTVTRRVIPGYDPTSTAPGDMYYRDGLTGNLETVPIGTNGQVLTIVGLGVPSWQSLPVPKSQRSFAFFAG